MEVDQAKVAGHLAQYFSTIADGIGGDNVHSLTEEDYRNHKSVKDIRKNLMNITNEYFEFTTLSSKIIQDTLEELNPKKATGHDKIDPRIIKIGAKELAPSLAGIFNCSIRNGLWVTQWKRGEWVPVFKKDDRQIDKNYRPITVLPCVDKVYEKLLGRQISEFMDPRLNEAITAYRPRNGCKTTLLRLVENWKTELDRKNFVGVLSSDMSKAFDSLCPSLLINKLQAYNFSENSINLIRSYFEQRENRVRMGTVTSDWKVVGRGCPQGSTFGPLMWNIFQNDLPRQIEANISMYADDHQIYVASESLKRVEERLIENGERMTKWYEDNMLQVNFDKYQCMLLGHKNKERTVNISIERENVEQSQSIKILGVHLDEQLNFSYHISEICKRTSRQVGILNRLRNLIPSNAKLHLYKSAILPHLTYCHLVWHFSRASDRRKLERLQERALRAVFNYNKSDTYGFLLQQAKLTTLYDRRLQDILILMYKVKNGLTPKYISDLFQANSEDRTYNLRNSDFSLPRYNTVTYGKHSIGFLGPSLWAKLTNKERNIETLSSFKNMIRKKDISAVVEGCGRDCYLCLS